MIKTLPKISIPLSKKFYMALVIFYLAFAFCWGVFYMQVSEELKRNTNTLMKQVSQDISSVINDTFLTLEHLSVSLASNDSTLQVLTEENPLDYYKKLSTLKTELNNLYQSDLLIDDILIYGSNGSMGRLRGSMGNTALKKIYSLPEQYGYHIINVSGEVYISYSTPIYNRSTYYGCLVFLMDAKQVQEIINSFTLSSALQISLLSNDQPIVTTGNLEDWISLEETIAQSNTYYIRNIGISNFKLLVSDQGSFLNQLPTQYMLVSGITALLLFILIFLLYLYLNDIFFKPVSSLISQAKLNDGKALNLTGQEEFDLLITQINEMVVRIQEKNDDLNKIRFHMQKTEFEKQQAVTISLKKQINAHFTINTINIINTLIQQNKMELAQQMCLDFSHIIHYTNHSDEFISILEEVIMLEKYINMMQVRYPNRFEVEFTVDEEIMELYSIPRMLVQPLFENAIMHGMTHSSGHHLSLHIFPTKTALIFLIQDDGMGFLLEKLEALENKLALVGNKDWTDIDTEHISLENIQKRILSHYGPPYGIEIDSTYGMGTKIFLKFPLIE